MKKLTSLQKDLQKRIILHVLDQSINADLQYVRDNVGNATLLFTYHDNETCDQIFKLKREIFDKFNVYFDSGFFTQEPIIEWSLDYSITSDN